MFLFLKAAVLFMVIRNGNIFEAVVTYSAVTSISSLVNLLVIFRLLKQDLTHLMLQSAFAFAALLGIFMLKVV